MMFWTKEQYLKFAEVMMDKPQSFYAFEMLYWCGIREGELLALTPADFDFEKGTVSISKSYQRLNGQDLITTPKTEKSNRVITMPQFLTDEIQDYLKMLYGIGLDDRMFTVTKSYLHREMDRGAKEAGVPRIRIHDIRHSAVSLLIDMGFSATAIADRVGHESIDITYNYAHLFPSKQTEMADKLTWKGAIENVSKEFGQAQPLAEQNSSLPGLPRGGRAAGNLRQAVRPDETGLHHPATAGTGCGGAGQSQGLQALRDQFAAVLDELRRIEDGQGVSDELLDTIQMIASIMNGMQEEAAYGN